MCVYTISNKFVQPVGIFLKRGRKDNGRSQLSKCWARDFG